MMEEIINSVMQSPENTNPNVLRSQLQGVSGSGGGWNPYVVEIVPGTEEGSLTTDASFEVAKEKFLNCEPVLFKITGLPYLPAATFVVSPILYTHGNDLSALEGMFSSESNIQFLSDGRVRIQ